MNENKGEFFARELPVQLSESERADRGRELADLMMVTELRRRDVKAKIKTLRKSIKDLEEDAHELSAVVRNGSECRMVECRRIVDFAAGVLREVRLDTGEQINTRALRPDEMPPPVDKPAGDDEQRPEETPAATVIEVKPTLAMIWPAGGKKGEDKAPAAATDGDVFEHLITSAIDIIKQTRRASLSSLQRRLRITFNNAAMVMDELEKRGLVGAATEDGAPREILPAMDGHAVPAATSDEGKGEVGT